jgi:hypothetical protein
METSYPTGPGYAGFFLVAFRKDPADPATTQRVGTVVLKRTYHIDPVAGTVAPEPAAVPVFMTNQADNLVANSDFEELDSDANPVAWTPEGVTAERVVDPLNPGNGLLRVPGAVGGRVVQDIRLDQPLGGRTFSFSVTAAAEQPATRVEGLRLEADETVLCPIAPSLNTNRRRLSASGTWPAGLAATGFRVMLGTATDPARGVLYDRVQVEERGAATDWDPSQVPRYEHDLAAFKPEADVVVVGHAQAPPPPPPQVVRVLVDGTEWFRRTLPGGRPKAALGWEPTNQGPRRQEAGTVSSDPADYPPADPLPADFSNHWFNGHLRSARQLSPVPYLPAAASVGVERSVGQPYRFTLRGDAPTAEYRVVTGGGADRPEAWGRQALDLAADTLVVEPELDRCYLVWRGVWPFDQHPEDSYRRLTVTAPP